VIVLTIKTNWEAAAIASSYRTLKLTKMETVQQQVTPVTDAFNGIDSVTSGKSSFLVFKHNKYFIVPTENIAFFYVKYETSTIVCFDKQEYFLNYSLKNIQALINKKKFFRLNRQYLVNFHAVKEVEHYFARKLLVCPVIPARGKLVVSKEKVSSFLHWLDNR
jgi:two-component system response regulator LytT